MDNPIGIFDSGLGGLTVYKEVRSLCKEENIIYYADTKRAPYGDKSRKALLIYAREIIAFLQKRNVKIIIIACNTISANSYHFLRENYKTPIFEPINFAITSAVRNANKGIGVLATQATVNSGVFERGIHAVHHIPIYQVACPLFVPLIEEGIRDEKIILPIVRKYMQSLVGNIDTLILGCTHYPFLINSIQKVIGNVNIINPAYSIAHSVKDYLASNNMQKSFGKGYDKFYTSGDNDRFAYMRSILLQQC